MNLRSTWKYHVGDWLIYFVGQVQTTNTVVTEMARDLFAKHLWLVLDCDISDELGHVVMRRTYIMRENDTHQRQERQAELLMEAAHIISGDEA